MNANRVWQNRAPSTVTLLDGVFFSSCFFIFFCSFSCRERPQENFEPHRVVVVGLVRLSYTQRKELHAGVCHVTITMRVLITNVCRHLNAGIRFYRQQKETQIGVFTSVPQREQLLSQDLMRFLFAFFSMLINVFSPSAGTSQHVCCLIYFFFVGHMLIFWAGHIRQRGDEIVQAGLPFCPQLGAWTLRVQLWKFKVSLRALVRNNGTTEK